MKKTTKPKILFSLHLPPPVHGSAVVGQSIKESTIINDSFECRYINLLVSKRINETGKTSSLKIFRFIGIWFNFLSEILFNRPDLCYLALTVSGSAFYKDVLLVVFLRIFRIQHIFHLHNKGINRNKKNLIYRILYNFVFRKSEVILLSSVLYSDIEAFVPMSRIHICPNGTNDLFFNFKRQTIDEERKVSILFLSNLIESKGVFVLLEACSILQQRGIDFECNFVGAEGDISESQFVDIVRNMQLSDKVHYLGKKISEEKLDFFIKADIFAFPTYSECFPLVLLEAMSCSLPVISTFEGAIPDEVEDGRTGFLVPTKNAEAFADKLEVLIKNPELRIEMGKAGRHKYENEFMLTRFEQNLNNILLHFFQKGIKTTIPLKKVLFILHIPPPVHGASIVGKMINDSTVINNFFDCNYINLLVSRTINETGKSSSLKIFRFFIIWIKLVVEVIKRKPDLTYLALTVSGSAFYKDVLLVAVLKLFGIKRIYHLHNKGVRNFQLKMRYKFLYKFVFKDADVILLSKHLYKDIETYVPLSKVHICPNGIKDEILHIEPKIFNPVKRVNILFLSNLIDTKGVTVLLEACSLLTQKGIDFECNFIGAEGDVDAFQFNSKVKFLNLEKNVSYLGSKYGLEKKEYFINADIFAFPTFYPNECFPLVLLEAMSYSLPIVSTFEGGIPDEVEDGITGFVIEQKNVYALAEKLEILILNPGLRKQMGEAGRHKFENEFDLNEFEEKLKKILHKVMVK